MEELKENPGHIWWIPHGVSKLHRVHQCGNDCLVPFAHHLDTIVEQFSTFCTYIGETPIHLPLLGSEVTSQVFGKLLLAI
jgi:hypothetical protein